MRFTFEADMVKGQCYRCPLWQEDYDEDGGWAEYCKLDHEVDAYDEDPSCCPLKESNEVVWHPYPEEKPTRRGNYLVTLNVGGGKKMICTLCSPQTGDFNTDSVLAWAELPEPYKEEDE